MWGLKQSTVYGQAMTRQVKMTVVVSTIPAKAIENRNRKNGTVLFFFKSLILSFLFCFVLFRLETSLDGPVSPTHLSPTHSIISRSHSALPPTVLSPEEKYLSSSSTTSQNPSPLSPKLPLEIPAESNPSPRIPEANIELFNNNNIPRNGTIVQAGHCKPYYEETKPFEMSDFYKYSTKFKKSPVKTDDNVKKTCSTNFQKNLNESFDAPVASPSSRSPYLGWVYFVL